MIKFSYIIPVQNTQNYLEQCLQSIIKQNFTDYEIILVDDGSTDNSGNICDYYAEKYSQIRVIHQEQGGLSKARNSGIKTAQGEYFLLIDSDDFIFSEQLESLHEKCSEEVDIVAFEYMTFQNKKETIDPKPVFAFPQQLTEVCEGPRFLETVLQTAQEHSAFYQWPAWTYCYRRAFFQQHRFEYPVGRNFEDLFLTWRVLLVAKRVTALPNVLYAYRINVGGSITKTYNYKNINDRLLGVTENMQELSLLFRQKKISAELKEVLEDHFSEHYFIVLTMSDLPETREQRKILMSDLKKNIWISNCSLRKPEQFLAKLIRIFGLKSICALLHIRRKIIYHGQFKRSKSPSD